MHHNIYIIIIIIGTIKSSRTLQSGFTPMVNANEDERSRSKVRKWMEENEDGLMMGSTKMEEDKEALMVKIIKRD